MLIRNLAVLVLLAIVVFCLGQGFMRISPVAGWLALAAGVFGLTVVYYWLTLPRRPL